MYIFKNIPITKIKSEYKLKKAVDSIPDATTGIELDALCLMDNIMFDANIRKENVSYLIFWDEACWF